MPIAKQQNLATLTRTEHGVGQLQCRPVIATCAPLLLPGQGRRQVFKSLRLNPSRLAPHAQQMNLIKRGILHALPRRFQHPAQALLAHALTVIHHHSQRPSAAGHLTGWTGQGHDQQQQCERSQAQQASCATRPHGVIGLALHPPQQAKQRRSQQKAVGMRPVHFSLFLTPNRTRSKHAEPQLR